MRACSLPALLLVLAPAGAAQAAPAPQDEDALIVAGKKDLPGLTLEIVAPKVRYELGEPIEVRRFAQHAAAEAPGVTLAHLCVWWWGNRLQPLVQVPWKNRPPHVFRAEQYLARGLFVDRGDR